MRPPSALVCPLAYAAAGWTLRAILGRHRPVCLAAGCRKPLGTVAYDLTGGNRAAAVYGCHHCGSTMTVRVPTPGSAAVERLPADEAARG